MSHSCDIYRYSYYISRVSYIPNIYTIVNNISEVLAVCFIYFFENTAQNYYYCCCYITCREDDRPNKYILYAREINIGSEATVMAAAATASHVYTMGYTCNI